MKPRTRAIAVIACTTILACSFTARLDTPDAGPCKTAPSLECAGDMLRACTVVGEIPADTPCRWGCLKTGQPHCGAITPSGGGATAMDLDPATFGAVTDVVINAPTMIDGNNGTISGITAGFTHSPRAGGTIGVFRFKSLTINAQVRLIGGAAIVLVANETITVNSIIDAKGPCTIGISAVTPGPGGFQGGSASSENGFGLGGGRLGTASAGAGGGGHGGIGGAGGDFTLPASSQAGGLGGVSTGTETIDVLAGGGGGASTEGGGGRGHGGGGGGAIQLVSNTRINLTPNGGIDAGGCGGDTAAGGNGDGGGGGGAGGAILLEAPVIEGLGKLAVNGGGGGAGDDNGVTTRPEAAGSNGTLSRIPATGAPAQLVGAAGGQGAAAAMYTGTKGGDTLMNHAGGGGGAVGRIRLNTKTGNVAATGVMSPALMDPGSTCTAGSANVQ